MSVKSNRQWVDDGVANSASEVEQLDRLFKEHQEHNNKFFTGSTEADAWLHDEDVTLHGGFNVSLRGWSSIERGLEAAASRLSDGRMTFTPLGGRIIGDMAYVAGIEEGTVRVDDGELQPMKLRVTMVHMRVGGKWLAIHRHGEMLRSIGAPVSPDR